MPNSIHEFSPLFCSKKLAEKRFGSQLIQAKFLKSGIYLKQNEDQLSCV